MPRRRAQHPREGACTSVCGAFAHPRVLASIRDVKSRHMRLQRIARLVLKPCEWLTLHYAAANIPIIGALTTLTRVRSLTMCDHTAYRLRLHQLRYNPRLF